MGVFKRKDSAYYWILVPRHRQKPLRQSTQIPIDGGNRDDSRANKVMAKQYYAQMVRLLMQSKRIDHMDLPLPKPPAKSDLYFIRCDDRIKIGRSRNVSQRLRDLTTQSGRPDYVLIGIVKGAGSYENALHRQFASQRICGEWFQASDELEKIIASLVNEGARKLA